MPLAFLLDTNICIYIAKQRPASVEERFSRLAAGSVCMSIVTYGELRYGAEKSIRSKEALSALQQLATLIPVRAMEPGAGECYGRLRLVLERDGVPIGSNDLWIASHALALELTLVSNNTREFERVPGLRLENWA